VQSLIVWGAASAASVCRAGLISMHFKRHLLYIELAYLGDEEGPGDHRIAIRAASLEGPMAAMIP
jgi:hypothetical protein